MPDFSAAFSAGTTVSEWTDPALATAPFTPTRQNAFIETPHLHQVGTVGVQVEITATVLGVVGEVDANLGGRLFAMHYAEVPQLPPPAISSPAGQTSVQRFTPPAAGHYTLRLERSGATGGSVFLHVDVV